MLSSRQGRCLRPFDDPQHPSPLPPPLSRLWAGGGGVGVGGEEAREMSDLDAAKLALFDELVEALSILRIFAGRVCDSNLDEDYKDDCLMAIQGADVALDRVPK